MFVDEPGSGRRAGGEDRLTGLLALYDRRVRSFQRLVTALVLIAVVAGLLAICGDRPAATTGAQSRVSSWLRPGAGSLPAVSTTPRRSDVYREEDGRFFAR